MTFPIPSPDAIQAVLKLDSPPVFVNDGGFKAVYSAEFPGAREAVKAVFIPSSAGPYDDDDVGAQFLARAEREIEALRLFSIPGIVKLGSVSPTLVEIDGARYLLYSEEFLPGDTLDRWVSRDPKPSFEELRALLATLIDVIESLSVEGFIHRDIKPSNVMETGLEGRPFVVLDLGIAFRFHATDLTRGGGPPGTLRYMAPELLKPNYKDVMDFRCDLYSAGLTVYVVAGGVHPFSVDPANPYSTVFNIVHVRPTPLGQLRGDLPPRFCGIIDRCMRKKPALRYSNLSMVRRELEEVSQ